MDDSKAYITKFPDSLRNSRDLQLGTVYLRYQGYENLPSLLTIYEIEKPAILAFTEINKMANELESSDVSEYAIKGIFTLAVAQFETMLSDQMKKLLQFFPQKITLLKRKNGETNRDGREITVSQSTINKGNILESIIENEINKLSYSDIGTQIDCFSNTLSIKLEYLNEHLDELLEIKETRNLLLHNNLFVNEFYLHKTKSVKRANELDKRIVIDRDYAVNSLTLLSTIVESVIVEVRDKYGKCTLLHLFKELWGYTFTNKAIRMEDFCILNVETDSFDGPYTIPAFISSSEKTYMEFWQAQRTSTSLNKPAMAHLDSGKKLGFLVEVFGELRLTHW